MCSRNWFVLALVAASAGLFGCKEDLAVARPVGGIDFVVRSTDDARMVGAFTLRRDIDARTWRLPVRGDGYQKRRVSLEPGLYTLDFEPDVSAMLADPRLERSVRVAAGELPRWVVVAPAQVTTVNVATEVEESAPSVAAMPQTLPDASLQLN
jgi:hypothetical protein